MIDPKQISDTVGTVIGKWTNVSTDRTYNTSVPVTVVDSSRGLSVSGTPVFSTAPSYNPSTFVEKLEHALQMLIANNIKYSSSDIQIDWNTVIGEVTHRLAVAAERLGYEINEAGKAPATFPTSKTSTTAVWKLPATFDEEAEKNKLEKSWERALLKLKVMNEAATESFRPFKK